MIRRIVGIAASAGVLAGLGLPAPATAQSVPVDDMTAVRATAGAGFPVGARSLESILATVGRAASGTPRTDSLPPSVHLVEGTAQPFLYEASAVDCLFPASGDRDDSVGVAQAIAGPAVDTSLPDPVIAPGTVNVLFTAVDTSMSSPYRTDPMTVSWFNVDTMQSGTAPLYQQRPADSTRTLSNTIETGRGTVVFTVTGSVFDNTSRDLPPCDYAPIVGVVHA